MCMVEMFYYTDKGSVECLWCCIFIVLTCVCCLVNRTMSNSNVPQQMTLVAQPQVVNIQQHQPQQQLQQGGVQYVLRQPLHQPVQFMYPQQASGQPVIVNGALAALRPAQHAAVLGSGQPGDSLRPAGQPQFIYLSPQRPPGVQTIQQQQTDVGGVQVQNVRSG